MKRSGILRLVGCGLVTAGLTLSVRALAQPRTQQPGSTTSAASTQAESQATFAVRQQGRVRFVSAPTSPRTADRLEQIRRAFEGEPAIEVRQPQASGETESPPYARLPAELLNVAVVTSSSESGLEVFCEDGPEQALRLLDVAAPNGGQQ